VYNIRRRLDKAEKQIGVGEKKTAVFEYTDENGVEQRIEIAWEDFVKLLQEIDGKSRGLPDRKEI
jgi:hypothetical protein